MKKYNHLFFDLDHTIWDFETNAKEAMCQSFRENNLFNKGIPDYELFYEKYSEHNHRLWDRYSKGFIKQDELKWKRIWLALLDFKIADEHLAKKMSGEFLSILPQQKKVFPYTYEILNYLKNKKYRLHLITNGFNEIQYNKLRNADLTDFFEEVITSEVSGSLKPDKEIFSFALKKTNASVEESIMIGDNIEADIKGAQNFGMDTIFVNHIHMDASNITPTFEIRHLKELENIF
ncbi:MAG: YjjG family noncanonical pyrimidine nucleotidase [Arachidicoccus sp.]|nr:YjjG family noncanonical pyrimidine nucleotidase [Arachidicoccus sp.]